MNLDVVNGPNGLLALAVFCLVLVLRQSLRGLFSQHWPERLLPIVYLVLGVLGSFLGLGTGKTMPEKLAIGIIAGAVALTSNKVGRTTVLGLGVKSPRTKAATPEKTETPTP